MPPGGHLSPCRGFNTCLNIRQNVAYIDEIGCAITSWTGDASPANETLNTSRVPSACALGIPISEFGGSRRALRGKWRWPNSDNRRCRRRPVGNNGDRRGASATFSFQVSCARCRWGGRLFSCFPISGAREERTDVLLRGNVVGLALGWSALEILQPERDPMGG